MNEAEAFASTIYNSAGESLNKSYLSYLVTTNDGVLNEGYGVRLGYLGSGTITNSYAIYIEDNFNKGTNNNFAIYSASNADSYFEGNVGIGTNDPQQKVHISGAMRLEPQATAPTGALGDLYAGTDGNLYFHDGTSWRQVQLN